MSKTKTKSKSKTEVKTESSGSCCLCGAKFGKGAMAAHLEACLRRPSEEAAARKGAGKPVAAVRLLVDGGRHLGMYWMYLLVRADAKLEHLDDFLRDVWLECCGHMSQFTIGGQEYTVGEMLEDRGMGVCLTEALSGVDSFSYSYDFGTTTTLAMAVLSTLAHPMGRKKVLLLARNDPPKEACTKCGKPAVVICTYCDNETPYFCDACADEHRCGEEAFLPVVNSPRCGVCGYSGPDEGEDFE